MSDNSKQHDDLQAELARLRWKNESNALRDEVVLLKAERNEYMKDWIQAIEERDALQSKLDKVRAECKDTLSKPFSHEDGSHCLAEAVLEHLKVDSD